MLFLRSVEPRCSDQYLNARPCALGLVSPPPQTQTLGSELPSARGQAGRSVADGQQVCPDVEASRAMTGQPRPRSRHGEPRACVHVCVSMSAPRARPGRQPGRPRSHHGTPRPPAPSGPAPDARPGSLPRHCRLSGRAALRGGPRALWGVEQHPRRHTGSPRTWGHRNPEERTLSPAAPC